MLFKVDVSRAFRHIRIDPRDIDLLGIQHNDAYIDASLAFGFQHGSTFFNEVSTPYIISCIGMVFHTCGII